MINQVKISNYSILIDKTAREYVKLKFAKEIHKFETTELPVIYTVRVGSINPDRFTTDESHCVTLVTM